MVILVINGEEWPCLEQMVANLQDAIRKYDSSFSLHSLYLNHHRQQTNLVLGENMTLAFGDPKIEERLLGLRYAISPLAFFQVNPVQTEVLYQTVLDFADLTGKETVFDLYCGTGSIALLLAQHARQVIGVEIVPQAIEDAIYNAQINGLSDYVQFLTGKAEIILPDLVHDDVQVDVVVVDPPRKGCDARLLDAILRIQPQRLIYVSCDPATLARDLAYLSRDGKYHIKAVQPVDMFPWTTHVETVVLMSRV
jgi:23S rRNA (uracil1939-C5)-methyltransferase